MGLVVERLAVIPVIGVVVRGVTAAAGIVMAMRTAGVAIAIIAAAVADVKIAVDPVVIAPAVTVIASIITRPPIPRVERVVSAGTEEEDRRESGQREWEEALHV
jgi:hypothetical protein